MQDLHPTAGVRILFELDASDETAGRYRAALYTPISRLDYRLSIARPDGAVTLLNTPPEAAVPLTELVQAMARSLARDALATTPFHWPRRLLRWRDK